MNDDELVLASEEDEQVPAAPAEPEAEEQAKARLVAKRGGQETDDVFAFVSPAIVGRFDPAVGPIDVDLSQLSEGTYVSRKHARIFLEDGVWWVEDLGSSNGTFILREDFEKVEKTEIADETELAFGQARFVFRLG